MKRVAHRVRVHLAPVTDPEDPSKAELAAIKEEMPFIEAQTAVVDAEAALALSPASEVAWRAHRRAVRRMLALAAASGASVEVA